MSLFGQLRPRLRSHAVSAIDAVPQLGDGEPRQAIDSRLVLRMTGSLVAVSLLNALVGFLFWWLATQYFEPAAVGIAAAAVSAMVLLGRIAVLGLGMALIGELPRMPSARASLILTALIASGCVGVALAGAFALVVPLLAPELTPMTASVSAIWIFAVGVALTAIATIVDQVLIGLLRDGLQLMRNLIFSVAKLAALSLAGLWLLDDPVVVYSAWTAGIAVSLAAMGAVGWRSGVMDAILPLAWGRLRSLAWGASAHHALNIARFAPASLMPIAAAAILSPADGAALFISLMIANYVNVVGQSATLTLYAVGARAPDQLSRQLRVTMTVSVVSAVIGSAALALAGRQVLELFGPAYAAAGYPAIAILTLRAFPLLVKDHWIAIKRVERGVGTAALLSWAGVVLQVAFAVIGAQQAGLLGLSIGWLAALVIETIVVGPTVLRSARADVSPLRVAAGD